MEVMETVTDIRTEGILNLEYVSGKGNDILCQKQILVIHMFLSSGKLH